MRKQYLMMRTILHFHHLALKALEEERNLEEILGLEIREKISKMKFLPEEDAELLDTYVQVDEAFKEMLQSEE
jgi:V/A-type H+-transporting ATPase subunit A